VKCDKAMQTALQLVSGGLPQSRHTNAEIKFDCPSKPFPAHNSRLSFHNIAHCITPSASLNNLWKTKLWDPNIPTITSMDRKRTLQILVKIADSKFVEWSLALMMEAVCTSETSVYFNETTRRYVPQDCGVIFILSNEGFSCTFVDNGHSFLLNRTRLYQLSDIFIHVEMRTSYLTWLNEIRKIT
jgi:hypothetical protein